MTATVIPLRRRPPPEARALAALLAAVADPQLRDYCAEQLRAAETPQEAAAALDLLRALGHASAPDRAPPSAIEPVLRVAAGGGATGQADLGQGPAVPARGNLSAQRKGKPQCIATSSSP
jgi:hypothetical protein